MLLFCHLAIRPLFLQGHGGMSESWSELGEGPRVRSGLGLAGVCEQHFEEADGNCAQVRTAG